MEKARIQLIEGYYTYKGADTRDLEILAIFLTDDVEAGERCSVDFFQEWVTKPEQRAGGMVMNLKKDEDDIVLTDSIDEVKDKSAFEGWKEIYSGGECRMPAQDFVDFLKDWKKLANGAFEEILVIKENGIFRLEAKEQRCASMYKPKKVIIPDSQNPKKLIMRNMFALEWTPKETVAAVGQSLKNPLDTQDWGKTRLRIFCTTEDGLKIMQIAAKKRGEHPPTMVMAYPLIGSIDKD